MKKFLPYVFPAVAILIVLFLLFRWYSQNDQRDGQISQFGEGVEIENLSESEVKDSLLSVGDYKSVDMESKSEDAIGTIRYEIKDEKIKFTVMATLPTLENGEYQVWLKEVDGEAIRKAFLLEDSKGGYMGSAAVSTEVLPFEVVVSKEITQDAQIEETILTATLQVEETEAGK